MTLNSGSTSTSESDVSAPDLVDDLILVSNRQPYRHRYERDGEDGVTVDSPAGGLTTGLDPVMRRVGGTWIAWGDGEADREVTDEDGCVRVPPADPAYTLQRISLSESEVRGYYDGFANQTLWPLCHSATFEVRHETDHWRRYRDVNEQFAEAVLDHVADETTVWFQDYHFTLAPRIVRDREPDAFLMQFLHVPWPAEDVLRVSPRREAVLDGLLGNDLLGFHVPRYCANFLECVDVTFEDVVVDWGTGRIHRDGHVTTVQSFPLGVDADAVREAAERADGAAWDRFRRAHGIGEDTRVAIGVDRLDYTKGIPERLEMFERLLETRPEFRGEVTYVQKGSESRERVPRYQRLQERVEEAAARVNDRFGTDDWRPIVHTTEMYDFEDLCVIYRHSDLAIVSPLRDGMNLVAKEYVASQVDDDGVLLLSRLAGAHGQLGEDAVTIEPYDTDAGADAIERALTMDPEERRTRMQSLRLQVHERDLAGWLEDVLSAANRIRDRKAGVR